MSPLDSAPPSDELMSMESLKALVAANGASIARLCAKLGVKFDAPTESTPPPTARNITGVTTTTTLFPPSPTSTLPATTAAPTSTLAPVAPCVENEVLSGSPLMCSTQCRSHDVAPALCTAAFPLGVNKRCSLECMQSRPFTCGPEDVQPRQPWPPPRPFEFTEATSSPSTAKDIDHDGGAIQIMAASLLAADAHLTVQDSQEATPTSTMPQMLGVVMPTFGLPVTRRTHHKEADEERPMPWPSFVCDCQRMISMQPHQNPQGRPCQEWLLLWPPPTQEGFSQTVLKEIAGMQTSTTHVCWLIYMDFIKIALVGSKAIQREQVNCKGLQPYACCVVQLLEGAEYFVHCDASSFCFQLIQFEPVLPSDLASITEQCQLISDQYPWQYVVLGLLYELAGCSEASHYSWYLAILRMLAVQNVHVATEIMDSDFSLFVVIAFLFEHQQRFLWTPYIATFFVFHQRLLVCFHRANSSPGYFSVCDMRRCCCLVLLPTLDVCRVVCYKLMLATGIQLGLSEWQPDNWFHDVILTICNTTKSAVIQSSFLAEQHIIEECFASLAHSVTDAIVFVWFYTSIFYGQLLEVGNQLKCKWRIQSGLQDIQVQSTFSRAGVVLTCRSIVHMFCTNVGDGILKSEKMQQTVVITVELKPCSSGVRQPWLDLVMGNIPSYHRAVIATLLVIVTMIREQPALIVEMRRHSPDDCIGTTFMVDQTWLIRDTINTYIQLVGCGKAYELQPLWDPSDLGMTGYRISSRKQELVQGGRNVIALYAFFEQVHVDQHYYLDFYLDDGYFIELAQVRRNNGYHCDNSSTKERQVAWDQGGKGWHRLEGKPKFKERGMSRPSPWAARWAVDSQMGRGQPASI